jgi:hypothetical protein
MEAEKTTKEAQRSGFPPACPPSVLADLDRRLLDAEITTNGREREISKEGIFRTQAWVWKATEPD